MKIIMILICLSVMAMCNNIISNENENNINEN
jgi:hypothetical protein